METKKRKLLFIDDDESICNLLKKAAERNGNYLVQTSLSGEEGLELAENLLPDLIVLDLMLPGLSGSAVAAKLKEKPATSKIPIIFLTGLAETSDDGSNVRQTGDNWIMAKPVNPFEVLETIERVLDAGASSAT